MILIRSKLSERSDGRPLTIMTFAVGFGKIEWNKPLGIIIVRNQKVISLCAAGCGMFQQDIVYAKKTMISPVIRPSFLANGVSLSTSPARMSLQISRPSDASFNRRLNRKSTNRHRELDLSTTSGLEAKTVTEISAEATVNQRFMHNRVIGEQLAKRNHLQHGVPLQFHAGSSNTEIE